MPERICTGRRSVFAKVTTASSGCLALALAICLLAAPTASAQMYELWNEIAISGPFSVTMATRGIADGADLNIRLEGYVGFNAGSGNQFVRHQSGDIATSDLIVAAPGSEPRDSRERPTIVGGGTDTPVRRVFVDAMIVDISTTMSLPSLDAHCCSNNAQGHTDDRICTGVSQFGVQSAELKVLSNGVKDFFSIGTGPSPWVFHSGATTNHPNGFALAVTTNSPGDGADVFTRSLPDGLYTPIKNISELKGVSSGFHPGAARAPGLDHFFIAGATKSNTLQVTHIDLDEEGDLAGQMSVDIDSGLPESSPIFAYHSMDACVFSSTGEHTAVGVLSPRSDKGTTDVFFEIFNNKTWQRVGGTSDSFVGARAGHPAWACETIFDGNQHQVNFYFDGPGQSGGTETRVIRLGGTPSRPEVISIGETDDRNTIWADFSNMDLGTGPDVRLQFNSLGVAEIDDGAGSSIEGSSMVRYGSIVVPRFFDTFETGTTTFWTSVVAGSAQALIED